MNMPEWLKPGVVGAVIGAIVVGIVGFTWGGWVTESTASAMAQDEVRLAMVPVCVEMSRLDPDRDAKLASIKSASTYQRRTAVMETGWATMPGADAPDRDLATACIEGLDLDAS